ncbi:MAG: FIST N-terminal domain-containing protein [Pseudolabrys sp.]|nr:FIST N-terminal domain-containing protein [Pseudolabrys sp.]MDP2295722.1 FIST N-terminal domain-containing protein [Pseudolabrys sp.]
MFATPLAWSHSGGWKRQTVARPNIDLVLYFGTRASLADGDRYAELRAMFPTACLMGCTTGGQIHGDELDDELNAIALGFDATKIRATSVEINSAADSRRCGEEIGRNLASPDLAGVFVLSDGLNVNGSELVAGTTAHVGGVPITGGLAGDGAQFVKTLVGIDNPPRSRMIAAIGFYGKAVKIGHGSAGGWDVFGPKRRITRAKGNILLELDGGPALDLYARYLGEDEIEALPGSALLFPLQINDPKRPDHRIMRSVLAVDRNTKSMTFAGDMPEGWVAQLMKGSFDRLALGAADAAQQARDGLDNCRDNSGVAILVSCIGRRILMGQRALDEIEAAGEALGPKLRRLGFYSYGEISPHAVSGICELHNQTMTVTTITEVVA